MKLTKLLAYTVFAGTATISCAKKELKPNVLFIAVDDLRPELGCYGNQIIKTPTLDKLASESVLFQNHFVQAPTSGASRHCLLTGQRPFERQHLSNHIMFHTLANRKEQKRPETFIHQLKRNGYHTVGIGKISHSADGYCYQYDEDISTKRELPYSWDELLYDNGEWGTGWNNFFAYAHGKNRTTEKKMVKPYECGEVDDNGYPDGMIARLAVEKLKKLKKSDKPFFMGVGFYKPHLPFNAPKKYWDLYNREDIPLSPVKFKPENVNPASVHNSGEFNSYKLGDEKPTKNNVLTDAYAKKLRHAYYAAVSYIDAQIAKVLDELKKQGLDKNTIVVVWGDHGWHLGDLQMWGKHTLYEKALKSTLMVKTPYTKGQIANSIVETVDIYPTIMELCGVTTPDKIDGKSFVNLLKTPNLKTNDIAVSFQSNRGMSIRTDRYRLTKYFRKAKPQFELYDHSKDEHEFYNIADKNPEIVKELIPIMDKYYTGVFEKKNK